MINKKILTSLVLSATLFGIATTTFASEDNNTLIGNGEGNFIDPNSKNSTLIGNGEGNRIFGKSTNSTLIGNGKGNSINSVSNNSTLIGNGEKNSIYGISNNSTLIGNGKGNSINSVSNNSTLIGNGESNSIYGSSSNSTLIGNGESNSIYGSSSNSTLIGNGKGNSIYASSNNSTLIGNGESNSIVQSKNSTLITNGLNGKISNSDNAILIGNNNNISDAPNFVGIGNNITHGDSDAVVLGNKSTSGGKNTVSIGSKDNVRKLVNLANGDINENSHDAINGSQLYDLVYNGKDINVEKWKEKLGLNNLSNLGNSTTKVAGGTNTTVTTEEGDHVTTYKVNVSDDTIKNLAKEAMATDLTNKANKDASNINQTEKEKWQAKLGDGTNSKGNTGLINGNTLNSAIESIKSDTTTKLDNKADKNLGNIDSTGETKIKELAKEAMATDLSNKADKDAGNIETSKWLEKLGTGKNEKNDKGLVTGDTLNKAIAAIDVSNQITGKANTDLDNLTKAGETKIKTLAKESVKVIKGTNTTVTTGTDGDTTTYAVNVSDDTIKNLAKEAMATDLTNKANKDASNINQAEKEKWQAKLGDGTNSKGNTGLINGNTLNSAIESIKSDTTTKLDNKADKNLGNIDSTGETKIKMLAKNSVKVIKGSNTTVTTGTDGDTTTYAVNVSDDTIKNLAKEAMATDLTNKANKDASNINQAEKEKWQAKLGDGTNSKGNTGLINGNTLNSAIESIKTDTTTKLDNKTDKNLSNLDSTGTNKIKDLAMEAVKVAAGTNTTVITEQGDHVTTYKVNVSDDTIKNLAKQALTTDLSNKVDKDAGNIETSKWLEKLGTGTITDKSKGLVTGDTVYKTVKEISSKINNLDANTNARFNHMNQEIRESGALSAALTALKPGQNNPQEPWQLMAGVGYYHNKTAFALGLAHYDGPNTMYNLGLAFNSTHAMVNGGVTIYFGKGTSHTQKSEIEFMQSQIQSQQQQINTLSKLIKNLENKIHQQ